MELQLRTILSKYSPPEALDFFVNLFITHNVSLHIKGNRKTRLGSFIKKHKQRPLITINGTLNKYYFAVVMAHEFAHFFNWLNKNDRKLLVHGQEWKNEYAKILKSLLELNFFPKDVEVALIKSILSNFLSRNAEFNLNYILQKYQPERKDVVVLSELEYGQEFLYNGKIFKKLDKRVNRCLCKRMDLTSDINYSFHLLTEVKTC